MLGDTAVVGDDAAAVAVDQAEDELFGGLIDECLLPGFEGDRAACASRRGRVGEVGTANASR